MSVRPIGAGQTTESKVEKTMLTKTVKSVKYQNSGLVAVPLKSANLVKQALIAPANVISNSYTVSISLSDSRKTEPNRENPQSTKGVIDWGFLMEGRRLLGNRNFQKLRCGSCVWGLARNWGEHHFRTLVVIAGAFRAIFAMWRTLAIWGTFVVLTGVTITLELRATLAHAKFSTASSASELTGCCSASKGCA
jgi:hypothetical protein